MRRSSIVMSAWLVKALIEGRKRQIRVPLDPQPYLFNGVMCMPDDRTLTPSKMSGATKFCPYGIQGDRLSILEDLSHDDLGPIDSTGAVVEIADVDIEPVQSITSIGAVAEGCPEKYIVEPRKWFRQHWDGIYADRGFGWDVDPWVWVIDFFRIDEIAKTLCGQPANNGSMQ